jgi:hypothetical protein
MQDKLTLAVGKQRPRSPLRRLGVKAALILVLIGFPLGQYSLIGYAVNSSLPALAGDFGLVFHAEEWSYRPFSLTAIARNVVMRSKHDVERDGKPLFTAGEIEFRGSLFSVLKGLKELLTFNTFHTFNEITIKNAQLHLERSRTGALNWSEFEEGFPEERLNELLSGLYQIKAVILDDVRVEYIENLAGNSGGGVIQTAQAAVHVDGIRGAITEIGPPKPGEDMPSRIKVRARSSDGTIDIDGKLAFRPSGRLWPSPLVQSAALAGAPTQPAARTDGFGYHLVVDLSNIGAAAFVRSMPPTRVTATTGSVNGRLAVRSHGTPPCESALQMERVEFAPNPQLVRSRDEYDALQRQLQGRVVTREYKGCEAAEQSREASPPSGTDGGQKRYASRVVAFTAAFNEQANADASPDVRAAVARDSQALTGRGANAVLNDMTSRVTSELAGKIGGQTGALLQQAAGTRPSGATSDAADDNAVTRGAKSIGGGIKRLFGGGNKKPTNTKPRPSAKPNSNARGTR